MSQRDHRVRRPEDVARVREGYTAQYLKELLGRRSANGRGKKQAAE